MSTLFITSKYRSSTVLFLFKFIVDLRSNREDGLGRWIRFLMKGSFSFHSRKVDSKNLILK